MLMWFSEVCSKWKEEEKGREGRRRKKLKRGKREPERHVYLLSKFTQVSDTRKGCLDA